MPVRCLEARFRPLDSELVPCHQVNNFVGKKVCSGVLFVFRNGNVILYSSFRGVTCLGFGEPIFSGLPPFSCPRSQGFGVTGPCMVFYRVAPAFFTWAMLEPAAHSSDVEVVVFLRCSKNGTLCEIWYRR